jgi:hypothetical protein
MKEAALAGGWRWRRLITTLFCHRLFDFASELFEMRGEALVKLTLPPVRRASGDLIRIVSFGA